MQLSELIREYAAGPKLLRDSVAEMTREELLARPVAGRWSTLEVVAHVADVEPLYADRLKRVLAENEPAILAVNPDEYAAHLAYHERDLETELALVDAVRRHMVSILSRIDPPRFERVGRHSVDGPVSARTLLERITNHLPHHVKFIREKREALRQ
jgi:uncharacterized damage-inducible protein DinB